MEIEVRRVRLLQAHRNRTIAVTAQQAVERSQRSRGKAQWIDAWLERHARGCEQLAKMNLHMHDLRREAGSRLLERGADLHTVQLFLDHANISTSSRYLKPSKLALHTTIKRIDAQRRESGEAAKWEQDLAELRENLQQGPQKGHTLIQSSVGVRPKKP